MLKKYFIFYIVKFPPNLVDILSFIMLEVVDVANRTFSVKVILLVAFDADRH